MDCFLFHFWNLYNKVKISLEYLRHFYISIFDGFIIFSLRSITIFIATTDKKIFFCCCCCFRFMIFILLLIIFILYAAKQLYENTFKTGIHSYTYYLQ